MTGASNLTICIHLTASALPSRSRERRILDFLDSSKTTIDTGAKTLVPYPASIWILPLKYQENPKITFWKKWRLSGVISSYFGQKRKCSNAPRQ